MTTQTTALPRASNPENKSLTRHRILGMIAGVGLSFSFSGPPAQAQLLCPLPPVDPWCATLQMRDCVGGIPSETCLPREVTFLGPAWDVLEILLCDCFSPLPDCGPVDIQPNPPPLPGYTVSCIGPCPLPGQACYVHLNGVSQGVSSMDSSMTAGAVVSCGCVEVTQACCLSGMCSDTLPGDCHANYGVSQGPTTYCTAPGPCCIWGWGPTCEMVDRLCCDDLGGFVPQGMCGGFEACYFPPPEMYCWEGDLACCIALGGFPDGPNSTCAPEACCLPDGTCGMTSSSLCGRLGGTPRPGSVCQGDTNGDGVDQTCEGDCDRDGILDGDEAGPAQRDCDRDGICNGVEIANCAPGDSSCADCNRNSIPDGCEEGACCLDLNNDGTFEGCAMESQQQCALGNGTWRGPCRPCPTQNAAVITEPGGTVFVHVIGPPIDCLAETVAARGNCPPGGAFFDAWKSDPNAGMCHNFGANGHAIPADFFGPGSDPFTGSVCLQGVPLGAPGFGDADTLIRRLGDPVDRCALPPAPPVAAQIDIAALSLASTAPITVTYNGGGNPELWNVAVDLSTVAPPPGFLVLTKTHCNGGTYTSQLNVQPRFTFTEMTGVGGVRVLDTGQAGIPYVVLDQQTPAPWVHDVDPNLGLTGDTCSTIHVGIEDTVQLTDCDCNGNLRRDRCDIEQGSSGDCNRNAIPDECDISNGTSVDVNPPNGIPDECELAPQPVADPSGFNKPRFVSFSVPPTTGETALRVKFLKLHRVGRCDGGTNDNLACTNNAGCPGGLCLVPYTGGPSTLFTLFENQSMYVGPPTSYVESMSTGIPFYASQLQCAPYYQDWSTVGLLHVTGEAIVPSSTYNVENLAASCAGNESSCAAVSAALEIKTTRWGDVEAPYNPPDISPQPDTSDISALVNKFKSALGAPIKARALLAGVNTRGTIGPAQISSDMSFVHISACVDAFKGLPYPYKPGKCAGGLRACVTDSDCVGSNCVGGTSDGTACNPGACAGGGVCTPNTAPCFLCP